MGRDTGLRRHGARGRYTIAVLTRAYSAAFTPGGDTLLVAGDSANEPVLLAIAAGSGAVLARAQLSGGQFLGGRAVAVDPVRPWLYVGWQGAHGNPFSVDSFYVDVYDRRSLALVATLRPPTTVIQGLPASQYFNDWVFVMDAAQRHLYLTANVTNAGVPSWVYEYDLMP